MDLVLILLLGLVWPPVAVLLALVIGRGIRYADRLAAPPEIPDRQ
jgi:hypothetical protein